MIGTFTATNLTALQITAIIVGGVVLLAGIVAWAVVAMRDAEQSMLHLDREWERGYDQGQTDLLDEIEKSRVFEATLDAHFASIVKDIDETAQPQQDMLPFEWDTKPSTGEVTK